jgi:hypothetical protein
MRSLIQKVFLLALIVLTATWIPGVCRAQEYRATITGTVTDAAKAVIPNAPVTVRNLDTNEVIQAKTSAVGVYTVPYLHPGQRMEVTVEATRFKKTTHPAVVLSISQSLTMDFALQVGNAAVESVTVTASAAQVALDSETADRGTVVDNKTITELPVDGRNPLALLDAVAPVLRGLRPTLTTPPSIPSMAERRRTLSTPSTASPTTRFPGGPVVLRPFPQSMPSRSSRSSPIPTTRSSVAPRAAWSAWNSSPAPTAFTAPPMNSPSAAIWMRIPGSITTRA